MMVTVKSALSAAVPFFLVAMACTVFGCAASELASLSDAGLQESEPVILLTGFEPFGPERPPNPSWEGIRELNGTVWKGYRLVAHEMPVVWNEPLKHLSEQIEKYHPVAVFSFGQGAPGAFALESRAGNARGNIQDNAGELPGEPLIVSDGPKEFHATFPCQRVMEVLQSRGYPVRVSDRAGQYLCEEMLYSLEYTRSRRQPGLTVSFCHVPPLGSVTGVNGEQPVDSELVRRFVLDYLDAWQTVSAAQEKPTAPAAAKKPAGTAENPELPAVRKLINEYFKSWSEQRMKDYGSCFADGAVIQEISRFGEINTQLKDPFVSTQATYHKLAIIKAVEVPVRTDVTLEADLARAVVYWKLTAGPRVQYGYDHFTLMKTGGDWKIINLVFYGKKETE